MTVYRAVKFFDLGDAPEFIRDAIRPVALAHISTVDATSIWEVTVSTYDWQGRRRGMGTASHELALRRAVLAASARGPSRGFGTISRSYF
jgi:hypothetical protein